MSDDAARPAGADEGQTVEPVIEEREQHADVTTVEALVRRQLSDALGGRRGMLEAATPTVLFTVTWLTTRQLETALYVSIGAALVLLAIRLVQRSTVQFVVNALFGIGLGWFFAHRAGAAGGSAEEQALAYFAPGIIYNAGYAVVLGLTCLVRWPLVGFMVGSVTGELTEWRRDRGLVKLCSRLTWMLVVPCAVRVVVQAPVWFAGHSGAMDADTAIAFLGVSKIVMGWPLQLAALGAMVWLLARDGTPIERATATAEAAEPAAGAPEGQPAD
ncbi:MAG: DUF3159 domain-containing protein [Nocardioides sp.]|uniref:DUF3159 domain-containing protein n=1 Tax=Nocardioides sp. TaxID=35761 RepID=UPI003F089416